MEATRLTFLGTADVVPAVGRDTACALLNGKYLIDAGWGAALNMRRWGYNPLDVEVLFLTHGHHDHYLGLPGLLFYRRMRCKEREEGLRPLTLVGPAEDVERILHLARAFLQVERFPELWEEVNLAPLKPGEVWSDERLEVVGARTSHPVAGLCYRFRDRLTGTEIAFSGDTAPCPALAAHVEGVALLVHEASLGPKSASSSSGHSGAPDAARLARAAKVQRLALVHCPEAHRVAALEAAQAIFPATFFAEEGQTLTWPEPLGP